MLLNTIIHCNGEMCRLISDRSLSEEIFDFKYRRFSKGRLLRDGILKSEKFIPDNYEAKYSKENKDDSRNYLAHDAGTENFW
jgi:hypothetical protein